MQDQVRLVAEGVSNVEQGLQRFKEEVAAEFAEVKYDPFLLCRARPADSVS
jgi:hypothetical protein